MGVKDREAVLGFLAQNAGLEVPSVAEQRANIDAFAGFFPVPEGTEVEPATLGGVKGEWVRARRAKRDAVLLYLHGGGYVIGSPASHRHFVAALGEASGLSAFSADYRLGPETPFPGAVEDAVAAYKGLLDSGIAPAKLAIAGDSAGGGLTIATLVALRDRKIPLPATAVTLSPWVDLTGSGESLRARAKRDPIVGEEALHKMAAAYLGGADPKTPLASPIFADLKGLPPLLIQVGTEETLYDDAVRLAARASEAGVEVSVEYWGGMIHVWQVFYPLLSEGRDAIQRIGSYLKARID
ncbi:MAG: alpha/beta hydrolase [Rhizomicrobium sp.]|jgi:acetyl esterase/lipase